MSAVSYSSKEHECGYVRNVRVVSYGCNELWLVIAIINMHVVSYSCNDRERGYSYIYNEYECCYSHNEYECG